MENIIFLDIDGVINDNICKISLESILVLKQLIKKYNAKIVMITSRQMNGVERRRNQIRQQFEEFNIYNIDFIDPNFKGSICDIILPSRLLGIVDYLKNKEKCNYIILDDEFSNDYKLVCLNYYKTKQFKGLTNNDLSKIELKSFNLNNFNYINYNYRKLGEYEIITNKLIKVLKKKYDLDTK